MRWARPQSSLATCCAADGAVPTAPVAERRQDLGEGTRSHCDVVVKLDADNERILAIGGNVRSSVRLKFLPARLESNGPANVFASIGRGSRAVFAHLKLQAQSIGDDAFETSPTIKALSADPGSLRSLQQRLVDNSEPNRHAFRISTSRRRLAHRLALISDVKRPPALIAPEREENRRSLRATTPY